MPSPVSGEGADGIRCAAAAQPTVHRPRAPGPSMLPGAVAGTVAETGGNCRHVERLRWTRSGAADSAVQPGSTALRMRPSTPEVSMPGKYEPLTVLLRGAAERGQGVVELTFDEVARLVGGLPDSARSLRPWWGEQQPRAGTGVARRRIPRRAGLPRPWPGPVRPRGTWRQLRRTPDQRGRHYTSERGTG